MRVDQMKGQTTAEAYWKGGDALPDDLDDAWVLRPGAARLTEVWDVGVDKMDGKIVLYTRHPEPTIVDPDTLIYYT